MTSTNSSYAILCSPDQIFGEPVPQPPPKNPDLMTVYSSILVFAHLPVPRRKLQYDDYDSVYRAFLEEYDVPQVDVQFETDMSYRDLTNTLKLLPPNPFFTVMPYKTRTRFAFGVPDRMYDDPPVLSPALSSKKDLVAFLEQIEQKLQYPDIALVTNALVSSTDLFLTVNPPAKTSKFPKSQEITLSQVNEDVICHVASYLGSHPEILISRKYDNSRACYPTHLSAMRDIPVARFAWAIPLTCKLFHVQSMAACPVLAREFAKVSRKIGYVLPYGTPCLEREKVTLATTGARAGCFEACPHLGECLFSGRTTSITPGVYNIAVWGKMAELADLPVRVKTGVRVRFRSPPPDLPTNLDLAFKNTEWDRPRSDMRSVVYLADLLYDSMDTSMHGYAFRVMQWLLTWYPNVVATLPANRVQADLFPLAAVSVNPSRARELVEKAAPSLTWLVDQVACPKFREHNEELWNRILENTPSPYKDALESLLTATDKRSDIPDSIIMGDI